MRWPVHMLRAVVLASGTRSSFDIPLLTHGNRCTQLCITLRKAPAFFDSISDDKRNIIRSMCRRLQNAERAEREAYDYSHEQQPASKLWFLVLIVGIGTVWYYRIKDGSPIQSYWSRRRKTVW